jgi:hypothetical protein
MQLPLEIHLTDQFVLELIQINLILFVQEMVHVHPQINVIVKVDTLVINGKFIHVQASYPMILLFATHVEDVLGLNNAFVMLDTLETIANSIFDFVKQTLLLIHWFVQNMDHVHLQIIVSALLLVIQDYCAISVIVLMSHGLEVIVTLQFAIH